MDAAIKKNGTTYGIILGVVGLLNGALVYAFHLYQAWWMSILVFVISIAIYCIMLSKTKKEMNGVFSFKDAFTTFFLASVIAIAIGTVFNILLYNVIDPGAKEVVKEETIKATVSMLEKFDTPASAINEAVAKIESQDQFSIASLLTNSIIGLAISCVLGLILALIYKSRPTYQE